MNNLVLVITIHLVDLLDLYIYIYIYSCHPGWSDYIDMYGLLGRIYMYIYVHSTLDNYPLKISMVANYPDVYVCIPHMCGNRFQVRW